MTAAGLVIFNDLLWTPADHEQAIARAYGRIINMHGVEAVFHVIPKTVEDWISSLLQEKAFTFKKVVDGVEEERITESSMVGEIISMLRQTRGKK
jgi:hypothetical protein